MRQLGTTAHGAVASTSYPPFMPSARLGERRSIGAHQNNFLGATLAIQIQKRQQYPIHSLQIRSALFDPPPFDPAKLNISYLPGTGPSDSSLPRCRRYTLTHNDVTGTLYLTVGLEYNEKQLSNWYTRIVRDEVLAEWAPHPPSASKSNQQSPLALNVYCHVSGEESWPAPPVLRSFIFQREMKLVLDTIAYAERQLLTTYPALANSTVYVHLVSDLDQLNKVVEWGRLGDRTSWQKAGLGRGLLEELKSGMAGVLNIGNNDEQIEPEKPDNLLLQQENGSSSSGREAAEQRGSSNSTIASGRVRGGGLRRSSLAPGRPGSKMVAVTAKRIDSMWSAGSDPSALNGSGGGGSSESIPAVAEASLTTESASGNSNSTRKPLN